MFGQTKTVISWILIFILTLFSIPLIQDNLFWGNSEIYASDTTEAVKYATPRYHFDLGVHHTWGNSGKWDNGKPGSNYSKEVELTFGKKVCVNDVYAYDGTNYDWESSVNTRSYTDMLPKGTTAGDFREKYGLYEATNRKAVNTSGSKEKSQASKTVSYDSSYTLESNKEFDLKKQISTKPEYVWSILGGKSNVDSDSRAKLEKAEAGNIGANIEGRLYFTPTVIEYYYPEEGDNPFPRLYGEIPEVTPGAITEGNNLIMKEVSFLDKDKNPVTTPDKSQKYYARFLIQYVGEDMTEDVTVRLQNGLLKNSKTGSTKYANDNWTTSKKVKLKNGETFTIEIGPFNISEDSIYTCATIAPDSKYNIITTDDFGECSIIGEKIITPTAIGDQNLAIKINRVNPSSTKIYSPETITKETYSVQCNVTYTTEGINPVETILRITIPNNSNTDPAYKKMEEVVVLEPGINVVTMDIDEIAVRNSTGSFPIVAEINPDKNYPTKESSWSDNKDSINQTISTIGQAAVNPCAVTDYNSYNKWTNTYHVTTRKGSPKPFGGCTESSYSWTKDSVRTEQLAITGITFKSKDSGTVSLLNTKGKIKAGYGFELIVDVKLSGTENPSRPSTWYNNKCNYQRVREAAYQLTSLPQTIYVVLPDGQVISTYGSGAIKNQMQCTVTGTSSFGGKTMRCNVRTGNTFGNLETNKLYVDENTKDGTYKMTVCTARLQSQNPNTTKPLFDKKDVSFVVDGKYTDDVDTQIVQ